MLIGRKLKGFLGGGNIFGDDKKDDKKETLLSVLTDIGTGILSGDKVDKLVNAVKTENLIDHVSNGMQETMVNFMSVVPVEQMSDNPDFIIKSVLQDCDLFVNDKQISIRVQAEATIYDRSTGAVVWSNVESDIIPVNTSSLTSDLKANSNETKIITAIQFASLSDEKVDQLVGQAAETVGKNMAEQLREDYAESKTKK